jgi:hypothetical protein
MILIARICLSRLPFLSPFIRRASWCLALFIVLLAEEPFYRHSHCLHRLLSGFLSLIFLQSFLLEYPSFVSFRDEIVCLLFGHLALLSTFQFSQCCIHKVAFIYLAISTYTAHVFTHALSLDKSVVYLKLVCLI